MEVSERRDPASPPARLDWVVRLRGVAALWVLSYHLWFMCGANPLFLGFDNVYRAGLQGVDLFFVLSGFVIAWPYVTRGQSRLTWAQALDFYRRRFFRITPVYYLSIVAAVALGAYGLLHASTDPAIVALHFLYLENFRPDAVAAIRAVYWTLPVEMYFYLLFPLILPCVPVKRPLLFAAVGLAIAIGYRFFTLWIGKHGVWLSWSAGNLPGRIDQFAFGIAAACAVATSLARGRGVPRHAVVASMLAALAMAAWIARSAPDPGTWRWSLGPSIAGAFIALMLYAVGVRYGALPGREVRKPLPGASWLYAIGLASLSLYIWHTFFIDLAVAAASNWELGGTQRRNLILGSGVAAILFSLVTYRAIEKPFIDGSKARSKRDAAEW
jgi:peptidoglycan/LPS O-acetylase OafA/YrhL